MLADESDGSLELDGLAVSVELVSRRLKVEERQVLGSIKRVVIEETSVADNDAPYFRRDDRKRGQRVWWRV